MGEDTLYKAIGERIRAVRRHARATQTDLAQHVGLTRTSISNIETGQQKVQIHTLYSIAAALEVSIHELLPRTLDELSDGKKQRLKNLSKAEREWVTQILNKEM